MKISILAASTLFFTLAQGAPVTIDTVTGPTNRHIIRHSHKLNCLNCFCGHKAIERARHACPADRDLILCPPSVPIRACYRCACYPRVPLSPSPPVMKPHPEDEPDEADDVMMETPDADDDSMSSTPMPTMKPHPTGMKKKPHSTMMPMPTKKPHPTMTTTPTKKAHPTVTSRPSKKPHPTNQAGAQTPTPLPKACASFQRGGGGGNTMFDVDLMKEHGTFKVSWQMDTVPDMIEIFHEDKKIFTTKVPVSGHGSAYVKYSGMSSNIRVLVTSPTAGTGWFLAIGCPKDDH